MSNHDAANAFGRGRGTYSPQRAPNAKAQEDGKEKSGNPMGERRATGTGFTGIVLVCVMLGLFAVVAFVGSRKSGSSPYVWTSGATEVSKNAATLKGLINPRGYVESEYFFEYGPTSKYGYSTNTEAAPEGTIGNTPVSIAVGGLKPNTIYHYRLVELYESPPYNHAYGGDGTFRTPAK